MSIEAESNSLTGFELCVREQWKPIYCVLFRLLGDPAEAEDLALEAFWRLYKHRSNSASQDSMGWLYRVAINLGLNALRARKRRSQYEQEAGRQAIQMACYPDPAAIQQQADQRRLVRLVLARMNKRYSQLLILRHSGQSYADLSNSLGVPVSSIGTLLARAEKDFEKRYRKLKGG